MTGERTLPVLEASHIMPYSDGGLNRTENGLLLRSDLHTLFDLGYVTITPDHKLLVSERIREEYENGRDYYAFDKRELLVLPSQLQDQPDKNLLEWHNDVVFLG